MSIFNVLRRITASAAITLLSVGVVNAGAVYTPIIFGFGGDQLVCIANNVSLADITVRVRIVGNSSSASDTCLLPPGDIGGCQVFLNGGQSGHCRILVDGITTPQARERVRGVLFSRNLSPPFALRGLVQAQ